MGVPLLTVDATVMCPHGGQGTVIPSQAAVVAGGTVCTQADEVIIAGCPFIVGLVPSPCLSVQWQSASTTSTAGGMAVLTISSQGLCLNPAGAPQGPVILVPAQVAGVAT
jgi:hypothetical protein